MDAIWNTILQKGAAPTQAPPPVAMPVKKEFAPIALSLEQRRVLEAADRGESFFLTGSAGVGKSFLTNAIIERMKRKYGDASVFVTASTGIAATHIGGTTLHSFGGFGTDFTNPRQMVKKAGRNAKDWKRAQVLIIDEISMISPSHLTALDIVARQIRKRPQAPMGGIQVIAVGDFMQLPYIDRDYEERRKRDPSMPATQPALFECKAWKECFSKTYLLQQVHRQKADAHIDMLQRVRMGQETDEDDILLRMRLDAPVSCGSVEPTLVYTHKMNVEAYNTQQLARIQEEEIIYEASDKGKDKYAVENLQKNCMAPTMLRLKKGAQVMLVANLAPPLLVNGSRGVVIDFEHDIEDAKKRGERYPLVQFANGETLLITRNVWRTQKGETLLAQRSQVPLCLAWALTVHKCQGMTLDVARLDISRCFAPGQAYVALSRCSSLDGMSLIGYNRSKITVDKRCVEFYARLGDANAQKKHEEASAVKKEVLQEEPTKESEPKKRKMWWDEFN